MEGGEGYREGGMTTRKISGIERKHVSEKENGETDR